MQTEFTLAQLADPDTAASEKILRACVHCGFCTATCPTYVLLGDELDSPRGRIYLIKNMLEQDGPVPAETVKHIDRCLSCLACMTTCPSGVHYMHLVDHGRRHIEDALPPAPGRAAVAPLARPGADPAAPGCAWRLRAARLAQAVRGAGAATPAAAPGAGAGERAGRRPRSDRPQVFPAEGDAADAGRAAARLRPAGAGARDQRGDDPAVDPARLRGRRRAGQRLLRRAAAPSRRRGAGAGPGARQYRRLDASARRQAGSTPSSPTRRAAARC